MSYSAFTRISGRSKHQSRDTSFGNKRTRTWSQGNGAAKCDTLRQMSTRLCLRMYRKAHLCVGVYIRSPIFNRNPFRSSGERSCRQAVKLAAAKRVHYAFILCLTYEERTEIHISECSFLMRSTIRHFESVSFGPADVQCCCRRACIKQWNSSVVGRCNGQISFSCS
jgi:hypothetical protein